MKIILTILSILVNICVFSQGQLAGTYMTSKKDIGFESDLFHFRKDKSFNYAYFSCTGLGYGTGTYNLTSDSLILNFNDSEEGKRILKIDKLQSAGKELIINIKITSQEDGSTLPGVSCYFLNRKIGTITNNDGLGTIKANRTNSTDTLAIQFVGLNTEWIPIQPNDSEINIELQMSNDWVYDSNDRIAFPFQSKGLFGLKLERYDSTIIKFNKTSLAKGQKRLSGRSGETFTIKN